MKFKLGYLLAFLNIGIFSAQAAEPMELTFVSDDLYNTTMYNSVILEKVERFLPYCDHYNLHHVNREKEYQYHRHTYCSDKQEYINAVIKMQPQQRRFSSFSRAAEQLELIFQEYNADVFKDFKFYAQEFSHQLVAILENYGNSNLANYRNLKNFNTKNPYYGLCDEGYWEVKEVINRIMTLMHPKSPDENAIRHPSYPVSEETKYYLLSKTKDEYAGATHDYSLKIRAVRFLPLISLRALNNQFNSGQLNFSVTHSLLTHFNKYIMALYKKSAEDFKGKDKLNIFLDFSNNMLPDIPQEIAEGTLFGSESNFTETCRGGRGKKLFHTFFLDFSSNAITQLPFIEPNKFHSVILYLVCNPLTPSKTLTDPEKSGIVKTMYDLDAEYLSKNRYNPNLKILSDIPFFHKFETRLGAYIQHVFLKSDGSDDIFNTAMFPSVEYDGSLLNPKRKQLSCGPDRIIRRCFSTEKNHKPEFSFDNTFECPIERPTVLIMWGDDRTIRILQKCTPPIKIDYKVELDYKMRDNVA